VQRNLIERQTGMIENLLELIGSSRALMLSNSTLFTAFVHYPDRRYPHSRCRRR